MNLHNNNMNVTRKLLSYLYAVNQYILSLYKAGFYNLTVANIVETNLLIIILSNYFLCRFPFQKVLASMKQLSDENRFLEIKPIEF